MNGNNPTLLRAIRGPILMITVGVLFALDHMNLFTFIANYWPFLLIAVGVLRLLEVLAYAASSKPLHRQGMSGGEIFLIILLVIIGTGIYEVRRHVTVPFHIGRRGLE